MSDQMSDKLVPLGLDVRPVGGEAGLGTGRLPKWAPIAIGAGAGALVLGILLLSGTYSLVKLVVGTAVIGSAAIFTASAVTENRRQAKDRLMSAAITSAFAIAILPLFSLLWTVVSKGLARFDAAFFTESARNVVGEGGGAVHAIWGTLIITGVATAISVPIGVMTGIYLVEYGRGRLKRWLTFFVDVMTGIPSIVAGLFAYALFAIFLGPGIRLGVIGAVALSVLMIPIVIRSTEEMLKIVPNHLREASYALGTPKWRTVVKVVIPTALAGMITGIMLAVARIIGETAPLLVTAGVIDSTNFNPFDGRMQNLAVYAFYEYKTPGIPQEASFDRAWAAALTLILIVLVLNLIARLFYRRYGTEIQR
jgi:phosphate transport system permease protein